MRELAGPVRYGRRPREVEDVTKSCPTFLKNVATFCKMLTIKS
jgi:hypothetical protein